MSQSKTAIEWSALPLGQVSDRELARRLGVPHDRVRTARTSLGIPAFGKYAAKAPLIDWDAQPLGKIGDAALARRLGVGVKLVWEQRTQRGIPAFGNTKIVGIDWDAQPLGQMPDAILARTLGVAPPVVHGARMRRGIPSHAPRACGVDWDAQPLGKIPDESLARLLGVSQPTVTRHRIKRGILPAACAYLTVEGQGAASFGEAQIDLFWHEQGIPHEFQVRLGPYIADWVINGDTVVEFAGFADSSRWGEQYRERLGEKVKFYESEGWKVLVIYSSDLTNYTPANMPSLKEAA